MRITIIGGGIGGLTAAIALRRCGFDPHVFEAAPELRAVGAGIWVPANAMQILDRIGLAAAVTAAGAKLAQAEVHDASAGMLQRADIEAVARRFGFGTVSILRARLQQILAEQLPPGSLHLGRACERIEQSGDHVRVTFAGGEIVDSGVLIAADGLRSGVRVQLFPDAQLRYAGQTSWRGLADTTLPPELRGAGRETWGAGHRFGFSTVGPAQVYWFAVEDALPGGRDEPGAAAEYLRDRFASFPAPTRQLLAATDPAVITRTDLYDLRPLPAWSRGRVVLIGDAAHAMTPNLGQGGAQAIEDAYALAGCLADTGPDYAAAFARFEAERRGRVSRVVRDSWWLGRLAHVGHPLGRRLRNVLLRATPARVSERQFNALFDIGG